MRTTSTTAERPVTLAEGVDLLARLDDLARQRERLVREVVTVLAQVNRAGVVEALEGLPVETLLAVRHGWTHAERAMLLDAGDVLSAMPATLAWWQQDVLSWSVVRDLVAQVRPLGREGRRLVDARLRASRDLLVDMDPDRIGWAVQEAVEEIRGLTAKERQEQAAQDGSYLALQLDAFGGSRVHGYLDAVDTAITTAALDQRIAREDQAAHHDQTGSGGTRPTGPDPRRCAAHGPASRRRRRRAARRAGALVALAREELAGRAADGTVVPARPLVVVHVPLERITETASGMLEVAVPASLPTLSATLVEVLSADADVRAVIFDGARPLAVTRKVRARALPEDTRLAVQARDLGARDPVGRTPVSLSHVHHLTPGLHHPDRLVCLSPAGHLRTVHRHGWAGRVLHDATVEWSRQDRTIRTRPWHTLLRQPGDVPDDRHP